ncbi:MAG TPA: hypothetical protein VLK84_22120 [Longimicrobium sp.]|nr:hypothetical protein [Longimicrobium sp.]
MPISAREDYLLRMIQQMGAVLARMLGLKNGGQVQEALQTLDDAEGELLGPMAQVVPRLDSATAAHVLGEPQRIAAWARLLHERADLLRMAGDDAGARLAAQRAVELAAEAQARAAGYEKAVRELLGTLADAPRPV